VEGTKSGIWYDLTLATDRSGEIAGVQMMPTTPSESAVSKDLSDASVRRQITDLVSRLHRAGLFSGIVVVSRGDRILVSAAAGYANRDRKSPITGSSQFELGSMAKMFTAIAVGQLVDQRRLSFDDTVGKFFPDYPNKTVRDKVTVGMLLSHTAGLGDFLMNRTPEMLKNGVQRASEFMPLYDRDEPQFPPGTNRSYSNAGFALAGAIVEKVSGETYPNYLMKHVFAAAGMTSSDPNNVPSQSDRLVTPYTKMTNYGPTSDWQEAVHDIGSPAGGAISTADDLVRFAAAVRAGKLVSKATLEKMTENRFNAQGIKYGYGFGIEDIYDSFIVGHSGGFAGVSTHLHIFLRSPYTVVVLANQDPPAEAYAGTRVVALVAEKAKREQRNPGRQSAGRQLAD
jgi:CubicO group peptidase (beta-lactamase class C family)